MRIPATRRSRERFLARQPAAIRGCFESYFRELNRRHRRKKSRVASWLRLPYWKILPTALFDKFRREIRQPLIPHGFLSDIQWGQYCLYLFIRFQDDVFDGQASDPALIYASDQCLLEADRIFAKYFPLRSWFWKEYRKILICTTQSIVEVDAKQRFPASRSDELLEGYARVSSILKVGSVALCAVANRQRTYRHVSHFCDEMAKAGQIMDDLRDLDEDLLQKRYNYVANLLRRSGKQMPARLRANVLLNNLRLVAVMEQISAEVEKHLSEASAAIEPLRIAGMKTYLARRLNNLPTAMRILKVS
ncbi:MAG: hypothetical protein ABSE41_05540 [Bacteroidota bacterium]